MKSHQRKKRILLLPNLLNGTKEKLRKSASINTHPIMNSKYADRLEKKEKCFEKLIKFHYLMRQRHINRKWFQRMLKMKGGEEAFKS